MELEEESNAIGFLASDGVLYCSMACAKQQGRRTGYEVDQDEYESLIDSGRIAPEALCPGCGTEFSVSWPEREPN